MKKLKIPKKIFTINDGTKIKCLIRKKYTTSDIKNGYLKSVNITIEGEKVNLPNGFILPFVIDKFSKQNKYGLMVKRKDLPKETIYYTQNRTITDWHGYEHDVIIDMPYQRYPREKIEAQKINIKPYLIESNNDKHEFGFVFDRIITKGDKNWREDLLFLINLSLELFDEFDLISTESNKSLIKIIKTNWQILPPGEYPFIRIKEQIKEEIKKSKIALDNFDLKRLDLFESLSPNFTAIGINEFKGYVVFGFKEKNLYFLENSRIGNAIYIFNNEWQELSKKTKKELISMINNNNQIKRIIHGGNWQSSIEKLLIL